MKQDIFTLLHLGHSYFALTHKGKKSIPTSLYQVSPDYVHFINSRHSFGQKIILPACMIKNVIHILITAKLTYCYVI
jgi:hypothetical protein